MSCQRPLHKQTQLNSSSCRLSCQTRWMACHSRIQTSRRFRHLPWLRLPPRCPRSWLSAPRCWTWARRSQQPAAASLAASATRVGTASPAMALNCCPAASECQTQRNARLAKHLDLRRAAAPRLVAGARGPAGQVGLRAWRRVHSGHRHGCRWYDALLTPMLLQLNSCSTVMYVGVTAAQLAQQHTYAMQP